MNTTILLFLLLLFLYLWQRKKRRRFILRRLMRQKKERKSRAMEELAKRFIGRDCLIYLMEGQVSGVVQAVENGAIVLGQEQNEQLVNLDFVVRIREYPKDKNGKRKTFVGD